MAVVGLDHAETAAFRASCEAGASIIGLELFTEDRYDILGRGIGRINSKFLESRGVPKVDPVEFFNHWMRRSVNHANPALVIKFAKKSGEAFDWLMDIYTYKLQELETARVAFWATGTKFDSGLCGDKFHVGTAKFEDPDTRGYSAIYQLCFVNHQKGCDCGGRIFFGIVPTGL